MTTKLQAARNEAASSRRALAATVAELKARLQPGVLAHDAGEALTESGKDLVKRNATPIAGVAATFALFLLRKPITALISRLGGGDETPDAAASLTDKKSRHPRGKKS